MKLGVLVFPGSNCDHDCYHVLQNVLNVSVDFIWHKQTGLTGYDAFVVPGGFSYGDYLRAGAIAKFSPVMEDVCRFANAGGPVLGICNGFQILIEAGLLPGALMRNQKLKFICKSTKLKVVSQRSVFTNQVSLDQNYHMPIAHMDGNYFIDPDGLKQLQDQDQIMFQYVNEQGEIDEASNPNGSVANIAGICNQEGNVLGMMPHPERVAENLLGSQDGLVVFKSLLNAWEK